jgi:integrase
VGRRESGTGSIYQRKDGSWVAQLNGTYRYTKSKQEAKRKLRQLLQQADEIKPSSITVGTALDEYLKSSKQNLKPRAFKRNEQAIEADLKPAFAKQKLHKLTARDIEDVYARKLRDGLSPASIRLIHSVLSSACKRAVRLKLVEHNVCKDVQTPRVDREEVVVFDPSEVQALLTAASEDRIEAFWVLALTTGARVSELIGLQVQDYEPANGTLDIRRSVHNGAVGTPKSRKGKRQITLPAIARDALDRHLAGREHDSIWMFPNGKGNPFGYRSFRVFHWIPLLERAGVPYRNFHVCRHTVASNLVANPTLPIPAVAAYLGHDVQTLLRTYAHCLPNQMQHVAAAIDEVLG